MMYRAQSPEYRVRVKNCGLFITGTDTGVGKTLVTGLLGRFLQEKGFSVATQKWVQTGANSSLVARRSSLANQNDIATHLRIMCKKQSAYHRDMSPYTFKLAASPHLAAKAEGKTINIRRIETAFSRLKKNFDVVLAEGSGGLMVPINEKFMMIDVAEKLGLEVLIVAENRLGAINQTLLTIEALKKRNMPICGIIFNRVTNKFDSRVMKDNPRIIEKMSGVKVLGELPHSRDINVLYKTFRLIGKKII